MEIQPALAAQARAMTDGLRLSRVRTIEGDAAELTASLTMGTVFLLCCPFGGRRLTAALSALHTMSAARPIRIACVDMPLPPCNWLRQRPTPSPELEIYETVTRGVGLGSTGTD